MVVDSHRGLVWVGNLVYKTKPMRGKGTLVFALLTVVLALLGTVGSSMHAHSIGDGGGASHCAACALALSSVEKVAPANTVEPPDFEPSPVVMPIRVAPVRRASHVRSPRGPPSV